MTLINNDDDENHEPCQLSHPNLKPTCFLYISYPDIAAIKVQAKWRAPLNSIDAVFVFYSFIFICIICIIVLVAVRFW